MVMQRHIVCRDTSKEMGAPQAPFLGGTEATTEDLHSLQASEQLHLRLRTSSKPVATAGAKNHAKATNAAVEAPAITHDAGLPRTEARALHTSAAQLGTCTDYVPLALKISNSAGMYVEESTAVPVAHEKNFAPQGQRNENEDGDDCILIEDTSDEDSSHQSEAQPPDLPDACRIQHWWNVNETSARWAQCV